MTISTPAFAPLCAFTPRRLLATPRHTLYTRPRLPPRRLHATLSQVRDDTRRRDSTPPPPVDPNATYYTECGACAAVYPLAPADLGADGRRVRCAVCENAWFQRADRLRIVRPDKRLNDYPLERKDELMQLRRERRQARIARGPGGGRRPGFSVFIGNLPFGTTEEDLRDLIAGTAAVDRVTIVKDRETGRSRGFGFATVAAESDMRAVVDKLDGCSFNGRSLTMREGNRN